MTSSVSPERNFFSIFKRPHGFLKHEHKLNQNGSEAGLLKNIPLTFLRCLKCFAILHKQHGNLCQLKLEVWVKSHGFQGERWGNPLLPIEYKGQPVDN